METKYTIGDSVLVNHNGYIECTVEEIHIAEGTRFRNRVKYRLRSNQKPKVRYKSTPTTFFSPDKPEDKFYTKKTIRYSHKEILEPYPKVILQEDGEDKWFKEEVVFKDMVDAVRRADMNKLFKNR